MKALARWRLVVLAVLIVGLITGARYYLSSRHAASQVANRLQGMLGVDVRVGEVAIGLGGSSSLKDVQIFEAPGPDGVSPPQPFAACEAIHADVSALDLIGDKATPQDLKLSGPSVVLRFDRSGALLTRLPVSGGATPRLPRVSLEKGTVTLQQEGREPFQIHGLTAEVTTSEVGIKIDGTVDDPDLGHYTVHATYHSARQRLAVTLSATDAPVHSAVLKRLPFLPRDLWDRVSCDGRAAISGSFSLNTDGKGLTYRATVEPHDLRARILTPGEDKPSFELGGTTGKVTVRSSADGPVVAADLTDRTWGRWLGDLSWPGDGTQVVVDLHTPEGVPFRVTPERLQALPLPPDWRQKVDVEGDVGVALSATVSTARWDRFAFRLQLRPRDFRCHLRSLQPALELDHVSGTLALHGSEFGVDLDGDLTDTYWGHWLLGGGFSEATEVFQLDLRTPPGERIAVTQERLRKVPRVPAHVWDQVQIAAGDTTVVFSLTLPLEGPAHYHLELDPRNTRLHVSSISLDADKVEGRVLIDDQLVLLQKVHGVAAEGEVHCDATLDFRRRWYHAPEHPHAWMTFDIHARDLKLNQLPPSWTKSIPDWLNLKKLGLLNGQAHLAVGLVDGSLHRTLATGEGDVRLVATNTKLPLKLWADKQEYDLTLLPPTTDLGSLPTKGTSLVVVVPVNDRLHFRIFDSAGKMVVDTDESKLTEKAGLVKDLRNQLETLWPPHDLTPTEKGRVIAAVGAVVGHTPDKQNVIHIRPSMSTGEPGTSRVGGTEQDRARSSIPSQPGMGSELVLNGDDLDLQDLLDLFGVQKAVTGRVTAHLRVFLPEDAPGDLRRLRVTGFLDAPSLEVVGWTLTAVHLRILMDEGVLRLEDMHALVHPPIPEKGTALRVLAGALAALPGPSGSVTGSARIVLSPNPGLISVNLRADGVPLPPFPAGIAAGTAFSGRLDGQVDTHGFAALSSWEGAGHLVEVRLGPAESASVNLNATIGMLNSVITIRDLAGTLAGGSLTGRADLGLSGALPLTAHAGLRQADLGALARLVPAARPVLLAGRCDLDADLAVALRDGSEAPRLDITLAAAPRVEGVPLERIQGRLVTRGGRGDYHLEGGALGGRFALNGAFPRSQGAGPPAPDGTFRLEGARLGRLGEVFPERVSLFRPFRGRADANLAYRFGPDGAVGSGQLRIADIGYADAPLATEVRADLLLGDGGLEIRGINGDLGGGELRGRVVVKSGTDAGSFALTLDQVEAGRLLAPFFVPAQQTGRLEALNTPTPVEGPLDVRLEGTLGSEWRGNGSVTLTRGRVFGLEVNEWSLPIDFDLVPGAGRGEVRFNDTTLQAARGHALGRADLSWGATGVRLAGTLRFFDAELRGLLRPFGTSSSVVVGRLSGRLDFGGTDIHSLDDLDAVLDARLDGSQALELPVLRLLAPYLAPGNSALTFDHGQIHARLNRGVIHLQPLTLTSALLQVIVEGTVHLTGALDLDVRGRSGTLGADGVLLRRLGAQVPAVGAVPVALVRQVTDLLANRLIHLRVTGNVRSPSVQLETFRVLTDEAVRFFVRLSPLPPSR